LAHRAVGAKKRAAKAHPTLRQCPASKENMTPPQKKLSHIDPAGRPRMVDVSAKVVSERSARAECRVQFPAETARALKAAGLRSPKGPVIDTAIVAGVMAAKRTHELIPFCHPLPLERCEIRADFDSPRVLRIECETACVGKTGVEMEALVGATVAALTVYDMCKALSHRIVVGPAKLVLKRGGKSDLAARKR
jgi:cyclic pyranopterin phosphate synthase